jgi:hypothetical protein
VTAAETPAPQPDIIQPGRWTFAIAMGATAASLIAFVLQLAAVPTAIVFVAATALIRLDAPTEKLARRLIIRFETNVTDDADTIERRPRVMLALFALFPIALAINAWETAGPDDQWNTLAAAITAGGCWVGWSFAQHGRAIGRPIRWFPAWLVLCLAIGGFHTIGGPFHARWAVCESRLTDAVTAGRPIDKDSVGWLCWPDTHERVVDGQTRLYFDGGLNSDTGAGLVYSPDAAIEREGGIRSLRDLGDGWYWFETGSVLRGIWFDG